MSEHVYIARAHYALETTPISPFYRLSIASDPEGVLCVLKDYWPLATFALTHSIDAGQRASMLWNFLARRFASQRLRAQWYTLSLDDVNFVRSITARNFENFLPECQSSAKRAAVALEEQRAGALEGLL